MRGYDVNPASYPFVFLSIYPFMRIAAAFVFFLLSANLTFAQLEKTIHQTFDISEASTISLDLVGDFSVIPWAGNTILTETRIELYDASPSILNHFVEKEQRYLIKSDTLNGSIRLFSFDKKRDSIRTKNGLCAEIVQLKVYVPDNYEARNETTLVRVK